MVKRKCIYIERFGAHGQDELVVFHFPGAALVQLNFHPARILDISSSPFNGHPPVHKQGFNSLSLGGEYFFLVFHQCGHIHAHVPVHPDAERMGFLQFQQQFA